MDAVSFKTVSANSETADKQWIVVDATDMVLGRLSSKVAQLIRGKYKPNYTPHVDCGDNVIVINCEKVKLTGKKMTDRIHHTFSGYPGGQKSHTPASIMAKRPELIVEHAVKGMLTKGRLGSALLKNLYVYVGSEHPHGAQQPTLLDLNTLK